MSLSHSFKTLGSFYERLEEILLVSLVVLMVSLGFLQILFRNLISVGIVWIDSLVRHLVLWIALLGASIATRENRHITIDVISGRVSPGSLFLDPRGHTAILRPGLPPSGLPRHPVCAE